MDEQNYLSPENFARFLDVMPRLPIYHMDLQKPSVTPKELQMIAKIQYGCALRIGEVLSLHVEDFNLETKIVTLRRTKTGLRKCTKCKGKDENCKKCDGKGKIRKPQFTSIPSWLITYLGNFLENKSGVLFPVSRVTIWNYYKSAGYMANLDIFEQQDERAIHGIWPHLLRKSYSKWMQKQGAPRELRMVKLRHANRDAHDTYDRPDIHTLIHWENTHPHKIFKLD